MSDPPSINPMANACCFSLSPIYVWTYLSVLFSGIVVVRHSGSAVLTKLLLSEILASNLGGLVKFCPFSFFVGCCMCCRKSYVCFGCN